MEISQHNARLIVPTVECPAKRVPNEDFESHGLNAGNNEAHRDRWKDLATAWASSSPIDASTAATTLATPISGHAAQAFADAIARQSKISGPHPHGAVRLSLWVDIFLSATYEVSSFEASFRRIVPGGVFIAFEKLFNAVVGRVLQKYGEGPTNGNINRSIHFLHALASGLSNVFVCKKATPVYQMLYVFGRYSAALSTDRTLRRPHVIFLDTVAKLVIKDENERMKQREGGEYSFEDEDSAFAFAATTPHIRNLFETCVEETQEKVAVTKNICILMSEFEKARRQHVQRGECLSPLDRVPITYQVSQIMKVTTSNQRSRTPSPIPEEQRLFNPERPFSKVLKPTPVKLINSKKRVSIGPRSFEMENL